MPHGGTLIVMPPTLIDQWCAPCAALPVPHDTAVLLVERMVALHLTCSLPFAAPRRREQEIRKTTDAELSILKW
jgi:hypothetical protein